MLLLLWILGFFLSVSSDITHSIASTSYILILTALRRTKSQISIWTEICVSKGIKSSVHLVMSYITPNAWAYEDDLPSFYLDLDWYMPKVCLAASSTPGGGAMKRPITHVYRDEIDEIDEIGDIDYVFGRDWKRMRVAYCQTRRRRPAMHAAVALTTNASGLRSKRLSDRRRRRRNVRSTTTASSELLKGLSTFKFSFSFLIKPTRATDALRIKQRERYPPRRFPTSSPIMKLEYGVPQISYTLLAHRRLCDRLVSAMESSVAGLLPSLSELSTVPSTSSVPSTACDSCISRSSSVSSVCSVESLAAHSCHIRGFCDVSPPDWNDVRL
ncbi:uncharacterized protein EI90DRAFT_2558277 [Cantharellus anzutake]|uniref:uncharacterized protein n=1 Tax=Cantharellus anzutake TaxID=1750568 RepID=UPI001903E2CF|nr:uncharacterized protein EI90DRAFT_2558277 [Cantharellus anzutake]KAF8338173.1 hypothetical protein EI90DRAFT_2558277 [Cantharellus anzutake]